MEIPEKTSESEPLRSGALKKRARSFAYAFRGIGILFSTQVNARIQAVAAFAAIVLGFILGLDRASWLIIILCIFAVFAAEAINTAIEKLADHLHPEQHPEIGKVKDLAAGAVLLMSLGALLAGIIIFGQRILQLCCPGFIG